MSQFNAPAYEIERSTGVCALSGRKLEPGETYMATLVEPESEETISRKNEPAAALGFKRLDVCIEAWEQKHRPEGLFNYWRTIVPEPNQKRKLFVDNAVLLNLFIRLGETDRSERLAFRFVLGLILIRKKILRYDRTDRRAGKDESTGEQEFWLLTPKLDLSKGPLGKWNEQQQFELLNPQLGEEQIRQVTEQLGEILEAEL